MCRKNKRETVRALQDNKCYYCGDEMVDVVTTRKNDMPKKMVTLEHVIRQCDGGTDANTNLAAACYECNTHRDDVPPDVWRAVCKEVLAIKRRRLAVAALTKSWPKAFVKKHFGITQKTHPKQFEKFYVLRRKYCLKLISYYYGNKVQRVVNSYLRTHTGECYG